MPGHWGKGIEALQRGEGVIITQKWRYAMI